MTIAIFVLAAMLSAAILIIVGDEMKLSRAQSRVRNLEQQLAQANSKLDDLRKILREPK